LANANCRTAAVSYCLILQFLLLLQPLLQNESSKMLINLSFSTKKGGPACCNFPIPIVLCCRERKFRYFKDISLNLGGIEGNAEPQILLGVLYAL